MIRSPPVGTLLSIVLDLSVVEIFRMFRLIWSFVSINSIKKLNDWIEFV